MDGQISIFDILQEKANDLRERYPIPTLPEKYRIEERWVDDWHYTEEEEPEEAGIYYVIQDMGDYYNYTYMAYAFGHWWEYAGYGAKWLFINARREKWHPFAWVRVPDKYYTDDPHYQFLAEHFVTAKDWEYEQTMERIREENRKAIEQMKKERAAACLSN